MRKPPGLIVVVDPNKEHIAVAEARKLGIPVMGLVDTNCDPDPIDHVIACNDDALKSIKLIVLALTDKIIDTKLELNIAIQDEKEAKEKKENWGGLMSDMMSCTILLHLPNYLHAVFGLLGPADRKDRP